MHAAVVRSAFRRENGKASQTSSGEVEMAKKCTRLLREAHFRVKMLKAQHVGLLLDVRVSFFVPGARGERETEGEGEEEGEGEVAFPGF